MSAESESKIITRDPNWPGPAVSPGEMLLEEFLNLSVSIEPKLHDGWGSRRPVSTKS